MGSLVEEARELRERVAATAGPAGAWAMSLTGAELRLLPYLATHLTFPEIATRLFISRNTVKTEAVSIYRKLGASSRSEAIDRAVEVGLPRKLDLPAAGESHPPSTETLGRDEVVLAAKPGIHAIGMRKAEAASSIVPGTNEPDTGDRWSRCSLCSAQPRRSNG